MFVRSQETAVIRCLLQHGDLIAKNDMIHWIVDYHHL